MSAVQKSESEWKYLALLLFAGFLVGAGMKVADWLIPSPPRAPLEIVLKESK